MPHRHTTRPMWLARGLAHLPEDTAWLGDWESARLERMRYPKRRSEFLISRLAAKDATALALGRPDLARDTVEVRHQVGGAPLLHVDGAPATLGISLTDRADWAVCLLGPQDAALGCDLELVEPRTDSFVSQWLTAPEQAVVHAAPDDETRHLRANLMWSAKESALKVLKTGLRRSTHSVVVEGVDGGPDGDGAVDGWAPLVITTAEGQRIPGWWRRFGAFLLTVAADRPLGPPTPLEPDPLGEAQPTHQWVGQPLIEREG